MSNFVPLFDKKKEEMLRWRRKIKELGIFIWMAISFMRQSIKTLASRTSRKYLCCRCDIPSNHITIIIIFTQVEHNIMLVNLNLNEIFFFILSHCILRRKNRTTRLHYLLVADLPESSKANFKWNKKQHPFK